MKTLKFNVKDKLITRLDCNTIVDGVVNQYEFQIKFDSDWDGLTKTVVWENGETKVEMLYMDGLTLPWEVCKEGGLVLSVNGSKTLADGRTQVVRTARVMRPIQVVPHGSDSGETPGEFTPSLSLQILAILGDLTELKTSDHSSMVAAINSIYNEAGIESIQFKETDAEGNNVYTVNLSRGTSYEIKAPIGKTGPRGAEGPMGLTGPQGPQGKQGEKGEKGDTGATGAKGETGATGATGPQGITPTIGENENWYLGSVDTGKPSRGQKGDKGETGAQGPRGATGPAGADGVTPSIGANGNWYLGETNTGKPSRGEKGEQGEKGATGDTGPQGETGPRGPQGEQGVQGEKGEKGNSGVYVGTGDMPEDCNVQIDPEGSVLDIYSKSEIDALIGTITDKTTSVENLWEDNITWQLRNFQRWGKLCFFSLQIYVTESISTNYGFNLMKLPYAPTMRIWINNGTQFYLDNGNQHIKVNSSTLNAGNYILSGMYLTNSEV